MMLELLMTRQNTLDQAVIANAQDLDFIVLDELHTYRGRQGADVAMLVRRLRDRLSPDRPPLCIGTSATMASQGAAKIVPSLSPVWLRACSGRQFLQPPSSTRAWNGQPNERSMWPSWVPR